MSPTMQSDEQNESRTATVTLPGAGIHHCLIRIRPTDGGLGDLFPAYGAGCNLTRYAILPREDYDALVAALRRLQIAAIAHGVLDPEDNGEVACARSTEFLDAIGAARNLLAQVEE